MFGELWRGVCLPGKEEDEKETVNVEGSERRRRSLDALYLTVRAARGTLLCGICEERIWRRPRPPIHLLLLGPFTKRTKATEEANTEQLLRG